MWGPSGLERLRQARARILLVTLPLDDVDENAAMVNALQRHATVIAQKSLAEGFGLTIAEGMWKGRPVIAIPALLVAGTAVSGARQAGKTAASRLGAAGIAASVR